jgi:DNA-binding MarR family transcriptional regulator
MMRSLRQLKVEVSRFGGTHPDPVSVNRLRKNIDDMEESLRLHYVELSRMSETLQASGARSLTDKQRRMLRVIAESSGDILYTNMIEEMSRELRIPASTVRWNLKGLRDAGYIHAGDRENKGVPVRLTESGLILVEAFAAMDD